MLVQVLLLSFGVVILELLTGRKPIFLEDDLEGDEEEGARYPTTLVKWVFPQADIYPQT